MSRRTRTIDRDSILTIGGLIGSVIALGVIIVGTLNGILPSPFVGEGEDAAIRRIDGRINDMSNDLVATKTVVATLETRIDALSHISDTNKLTAEVNRVSNSVGKLEQNISRIESAFMDDPMKAVEVPLLRKDLESATALNDAQIGAMRNEIERTNNLIIGTIVALALAVLTSSLTNLIRREPKQQ